MKEYILEDYVEEQKGAEDVSYIVKRDEYFFMTGYKVLQGREGRGLVECAKLRCNGRLKLVYFTSRYASLQTMAAYMDEVMIRTVLRNLISNVLAIQTNGFLKCENIDIGQEKFFVDRDTLEVYLIYLPVKILEAEYDRNAFENRLRTQLIKLLNASAHPGSPKIKEILFELSNGGVSLEALHAFLQKGVLEIPENSSETWSECVMENTESGSVFEIGTREFVIGKNPAGADGVIEGNPAVSRIHCRIAYRGGSFYLTDLKSSNGTFLNGHRLLPQEEKPLQHGDRIRIANEEFLVR